MQSMGERVHYNGELEPGVCISWVEDSAEKPINRARG
jgi:hypothetical protein